MTDSASKVEPAPGGTPPPATPPGSPPNPAPGNAPPSGGGDTPPVTPPSGDPAPNSPPNDDWRAKIAAGDEKRLNVLKRYASQDDWNKAAFELRTKLDAAQLRAPLPENPTAEQLSEYRKANGVPENAADYTAKLPEGLVIGADEKPLIDEFVQTMHKHNLPTAVVHDLIATNAKLKEKQEAVLAELDATNARETKAALQKEWGGDYNANKNAIALLLDKSPDIKEALSTARAADGTLLGEHPALSRWLANIARQVDPVSTIVPAGGTSNAASIDAEIAENQKMMRENRADWNRDTARQQRHMQLLDAQARLKQK